MQKSREPFQLASIKRPCQLRNIQSKFILINDPWQIQLAIGIYLIFNRAVIQSVSTERPEIQTKSPIVSEISSLIDG